MKNLHISTYDFGGAARAAFRLHLGLNSICLKSKMLVLRRLSYNSDVIKFTQYKNIF